MFCMRRKQVEAYKSKFLFHQYDNLSKIHKKLANKMNEGLLFLDEGGSIIQSEDENEFILRDIVKEGGEKNYQLYLKVKVWEYLNEKYSLDYGCKALDEILRVNKRAFTMTDCNFLIFPHPNYHCG